MTAYPRHAPARPFFLPARPGKRFCIYHAPSPDTECRGTILYVHPFGDEMNKARRMAALQARAFSAKGFGVLLVDLYGCGDADGEFRDARWAIWKDDLATAKAWLEDHGSMPVSVWGLRMGALLALDFAAGQKAGIDRIILWAPIISGKSFLTQFLRLRLAGDLLAEGKKERGGVQALRNTLASGKTLEVAGYEISPALAAALDAVDAAALAPLDRAVHWFEIGPDTSESMAPARAQVAQAWTRGGINLQVHRIACAPFWATQEIAECDGLVSATAEIFNEVTA